MKLDNTVKLQGWDENIDKFFKRADLFLLTSLWEGLPISLIEALVSSVPVVVSDTGGIRDILENGKGGLIIEPQDVQGFKRACLDILKNSDKWGKIMTQHKEGFNFYYWSKERMLKQIIDVYEYI